MSNINAVHSFWNFAQLKKIKKWASSQNLKSHTQITKIWHNNALFRRFGRYSFELRLHKEFVPNERETNLSNLIEKENKTVQIPIGPIRGLALPRYFII